MSKTNDLYTMMRLSYEQAVRNTILLMLVWVVEIHKEKS